MTTPSFAVGRAQWRTAGAHLLAGLAWLIYISGWLLAKALRAIGTAMAGVLFGIGWTARKVGPWCAAAFREGWEAGAKPIGGRRGPA